MKPASAACAAATDPRPRASSAAVAKAKASTFHVVARKQGQDIATKHDRVVAVDAHDWTTDPLFNGAWMSPRVGQISRSHSKLSEPHGRVFFAGSDLSLEWPSYIEGAVETGARAARDVSSLLGTTGDRPAATAATDAEHA